MKKVLFRWRFLIFAFFLASAGTSSGQTMAVFSADSPLQSSKRALEELDRGNAADVWDFASSVMQSAVSREDFVKTVRADRLEVGSVSSRIWLSISQAEYPADNVQGQPPGSYMNVSYISMTSTGIKVRELASLRLEADKTWRISGYVLQKPSKE